MNALVLVMIATMMEQIITVLDASPLIIYNQMNVFNVLQFVQIVQF